MVTINSQILLVSRLSSKAVAENFRLIEAPLPALRDGQVLMRHHFISPYMRGRMNDVKSYVVVQPLNTVMQGATAGEVVESKHTSYHSGDKIVGFGGWQQYSIVDGVTPGVLRNVDTTNIPPSTYLGAVGIPGVTAWYGLTQICLPKEGETVVVSAASGAVGSSAKCSYVVDELGFDACVDYKCTSMRSRCTRRWPVRWRSWHDGGDRGSSNPGRPWPRAWRRHPKRFSAS
jgi:NADPH-dependent curcumin reductase